VWAVSDGGCILNIQIFGKSKCFDTKKAERYFKERRIKYQYIDLLRFGMAGKEFDAVLRAVGGIDNLIDWQSKAQEITLMKYMDDARAKEDKVFDDPALMQTPIVRNGKQATVGYRPDIWATWE
jgi:arsenate reductase-like glutaredoxin family protein